jgi:multiple sugar transport system permease protein
VDILANPPQFLFSPTLDNYRQLFSADDFSGPLVNSLIIAGGTTVLSVGLGLLSAYGLARLEFRGRDNLAMWILSLRMMPAIVVVIPYYILFLRTHLIDTYRGMILVDSTFSIAFAVWLLRGFILEVPRAVDEAAQLDGCGHLRRLAYVIVPITRAGIAVTALFVFVIAWNEFLFAVSLTQLHAEPVTVAISKLVSNTEIRWGELTAASIVTAAPLLVTAFLLQKHIVRGLTLGAVK